MSEGQSIAGLSPAEKVHEPVILSSKAAYRRVSGIRQAYLICLILMSSP